LQAFQVFSILKLTVTAAFMVRDSHPIDFTHAGRTKKNAILVFHKNRVISRFLRMIPTKLKPATSNLSR
ncbi:hypothetical protein, partial [Aeribacillus pallidus]|uniref:hypothetical protein n=1 Tax=Aeribacillus pallidus TaxID=33936 RepID=UPI0019670163